MWSSRDVSSVLVRLSFRPESPAGSTKGGPARPKHRRIPKGEQEEDRTDDLDDDLAKDGAGSLAAKVKSRQPYSGKVWPSVNESHLSAD